MKPLSKPAQNDQPKYLTNKYQLDTEEEEAYVNDLASGKLTSKDDESSNDDEYDEHNDDQESKKLRVISSIFAVPFQALYLTFSVLIETKRGDGSADWR